MGAATHIDPYADGLKLSARGQHARAIERFEEALASKPDDTRVLFALGNTARALGLARPAEEFFRRVLALEPGRIEALVNLANLLRAHGNFVAAEALLAPALSRNPESPELWLTLGCLHGETGDRARAEEHYRHALALRPNYAPALGNLADLLADDGNLDAALALYDRVLRLEPDNAQARVNRAVIHLLHGNFRDGWRDYGARLKLAGKVPLADHGLPRWTGAVLRRERLLVTGEQGVGDQIMFASMIADLRGRAALDGGSIMLECEPRLVSLFARSFPSVPVRAWDAETRGGITTTRYGWLKSAGGATCAIEMGGIARFLRTALNSFSNPNAYLVPDRGETNSWRSTFAGERTLGICWRSGKTGGHRARQYAPLDKWAEFIREWDGAVVSVQYDATAEEIAVLEAQSGRKIVVPQNIDQKNELDRTCALLAALDAVISAPTAVAWLAAAAGVPTYKVLYDTSWTSFRQGFEPFAPSCVCVMPDERGNWAQVFAKADAALKVRFSKV
jgi:tetratricopeptide (TPR) repeat protein